MKTKILFIALAIVCSSLGIASAQKEEKVYHYCLSSSVSEKKVYVSTVLTSTKNREGYFNPDNISLNNQWHEKLEFLGLAKGVSYSSNTSNNYQVWNSDYDHVDKSRQDEIYDYKKRGYEITYVDNFYYRQEKTKY
jgi:hypothetical protein